MIRIKLSKNRAVAFVAFLCLILSSTLYAKEKRQTNSLTGAAIINTAPLATGDNEAPPYPFAFYNVRSESFVELKIDDFVGPYSSFSVQVNFDVIPAVTYNNFTGTAYSSSLTVINNHIGGGGEYIDFQSYKVPNANFGAKLVITGVTVIDLNTGLPMASVPANVSLTVAFEAERYYVMPTAYNNLSASYNSTSKSVTMSWDPVVQAEEYELEWTWIDSYDPASPNPATMLPASAIKLSGREFSQNCTRIQTKINNYTIPYVYARGFIVFRIRTVGRFPDADYKLKYYNPWSANPANQVALPSNWKYIAVNEDHETGKNWQFQTSYAEEGKKKDVVSYFDGSLRNRQTVTKINTSNEAIVGEVVYDEEGRPAIEVLPVPVVTSPNNVIKYYPDFNINAAGKIYSYQDFTPASSSSPCTFTAAGMAVTAGASKYYGPATATGDHRDYIPDAKLYPFSQTEYTLDNTGRIKRKGGVGINHQLGTNHEMKYLYATPAQEELNRLFGYSVGFGSHYKKNAVVDPNGQVSVSYVDPQGRTVATALSANQPASMTELPDEADDHLHENITIDLLNKQSPNDFDKPLDNNIRYLSGNSYGYLEDGLRYDASKPFLAEATNYIFNYNLNKSKPFGYLCGSSTYNYPTIYKLELDITNECGAQVYDYPASPATSQQLGSYTITNGYVDLNPSWQLTHNITNFTVSPPLGVYGISKRLTVDQDALEVFAEDYIKRGIEEGCIFKPQSPQADIPCFLTCEECVEHYTTDIGGQAGYVNLMLAANFELNQLEPGSLAHTELTAMLTTRYNREWELIIEACNSPCQPDGYILNAHGGENISSMNCDNALSMVMADMKPSGQYGIYATTVDDEGNVILNETDPDISSLPLSVYNEANDLYVRVQGIDYDNTDWRHPHYYDVYGFLGSSPDLLHYYNDLGEIDYVTVIYDESDNTYTPSVTSTSYLDYIEGNIYRIEPQYLANVEDFITAIQSRDSWLLSLVKYHPEFHYLDYKMKQCAITHITDDFLDPPVNVLFNSDGFDAFIGSITTFQEALDGGFLDSPMILMQNDPYFLFTHPLDATTVNHGINPVTVTVWNSDIRTKNYYLQAKRSIMEQSLNINTGSNTSSTEAGLSSYPVFTNVAPNQGYEGKGAKSMFQVVYETIQCQGLNGACPGVPTNFIGIRDLVNSTFTTEEKDLFWQYYVSYYLSLKQKIQHTFINTFAGNQGFYNDCIGNDNSENSNKVATVLKNYPAEKSRIHTPGAYGCCDDWLNFPTNTLKIQNGEYLTDKAKRFLPYDEQYDSEQSTQDAYEELLAQVDAVYYQETGLCPMVRDLKIFLDGAISDSGMNAVFNGGTPSPQPVIGYVTPALFQGVGANYNAASPSTNTFTVSGSVSGSTLAFNFTQSPASPTFVPIRLTIPSSAVGLTWNNYNSVWKIVLFENIAPGGYNPSTQLFEFSVKTKVLSGGVYTYHIFKGTTKASLNCTNDPNTPTDPNDGPAIVIGNEDNICTRKEDFALALKDLITALQTAGTVNSTNVNLLAYPAYTDSFLPEFFGAQNAGYVVWEKIGSNYYIRTGMTSGTNIPRLKLQLNLTNPLASLSINELDITQNWNNVVATTISGTQLTGLINDNTTPLEFACCRQTNQASYVIDDYFDLSKQVYNELIDLVVYHADNGLLPVPTSYTSPAVTALGNYYNIPNFSIVDLGYDDSGTSSYGDYVITFYHMDLEDWEAGEEGCIIPGIIASDTYFGDDLRIVDVYNSDLYLDGTYGSGYVFEYLAFEYSDGEHSTPGADGISRLDCIKSMTNLPSCPCVPQVVQPLTPQSKFSLYTAHLNSFGLNNYFTSDDYSDLDMFDILNLQYITDGYLSYISILGITPSNFLTHPQYISLSAFGTSALNYGYEDYTSVITAFAAQVGTLGGINEWTAYVEYYLQLHPEICPPAPMQTKIIIPVEMDDPCTEFNLSVAEAYDAEAYAAYIQAKKDAFKLAYLEDALTTVREQFTMNYADKEYQYTLYYYDQAGNLIQTVAPEGVDRSLTNHSAINTHRITNPASDNLTLLPKHRFKTQYKYNSLNQLVWQQTPDGGITKFAYDKLGRIVASQSAKQAVASPRPAFSYTRYDKLGRVTEAGEMRPSVVLTISATGKLMNGGTEVLVDAVTNSYPYHSSYNSSLTCYEVTRTIYDVYHANYSDATYLTAGVRNTRNRVTTIITYPSTNSAFGTSTWETLLMYNYDIHGNIDEMAQVIRGGAILPSGNIIRKVNYEYDLISGNVNKVTYQKGQSDQFIHKYGYDADNRITSVSTSKDGVIWEKDAAYDYYQHGPLSRATIGDKKAQGIDYAYTIHGWLKMVNSENFNHTSNDIGSDGNQTNQDAFAYSLSYYNTSNWSSADYFPRVSSMATPVQRVSKGFPGDLLGYDLYNGNIKRMITTVRGIDESVRPSAANTYRYDQLNRIKGMTGSKINHGSGVTISRIPTIGSSYSYDKNGNLLTMVNTAPKMISGTEGYPYMDQFEYKYATDPITSLRFDNKLLYVNDTANPTNFIEDLDSQAPGLISGVNYRYDENGQMYTDWTERLYIDWTIAGKVKKVTKNYTGTLGTYPQITFVYDGLGNRVAKKVSNSLSSHVTTVYGLDAQGNTLGLNELSHNNSTVTADRREHHIYGSSRIGVQEYNGTVEPAGKFSRVVGDKRYELANHLGNVLSVITDRKVAKVSTLAGDFTATFVPDVITYTDYYPFGMIIPNTDPLATAAEYRYGFQGQEKDNEIKGGDGKSVNYKFRMHDPRIGRFFAVDPLTSKFAHNSPYAFSENRVIDRVELEGLEAGIPARLMSWASKKSDCVLNVGISVDSKIGVIVASAGIMGGAYFATDIFDNYAFVFSKEAYIALIASGKSTSKQKPGPANGGSWNAGGDIGIDITIGARWDKYKHVSSLQSTEESFDINGGPVDVTFIPNDEGKPTGVEVGGGLSAGGGMGIKHTESKVLAFGDNSLDALESTINRAVIEYITTLGPTTIVPSFKETNSGIDLTISVYKLMLAPTAQPPKLIFEETPIHFNKVNDDYYEAVDVTPEDK